MNLDDLQNEIKKDSNLELTNLSVHSIEIPELSSKYQNILSGLIVNQKKIDNLLSKKRRELLEYYKGYATDEVYKVKPLNRKPAANEVDTYIKADDEWQNLHVKYEYISMKIKLIENFINQLNQRSFMIKNAIDWEKFKNGGY